MGPVLSEGLGVNIWSLLVMASLIGSANLHPKCASDFSRSIIARILRNAPRAATPGNKLPIRSFNTQTGKPEMLIITPEARPNHFVRPNMDDVFVMSGAFFVFTHFISFQNRTHTQIAGEFTYCRGKGQFLPEDVLHCPHLMALATRLVCAPHEIPARHLMGFYQLIPNQPYPVFRGANTDPRHPVPLEGSLRVGGGRATFRLGVGGAEEHCDLFSWEQHLSDLGLVVLPLVARLGAAVWTSPARTAFGCLVPPDGSTCNFDPVGIQYLSRHTDPDTPQTKHGVLDAMALLVPIGTLVCIAPHSDAWIALQPKFPPGIAPDRLARTGVRARLTVPPSTRGGRIGKLYLAVPQRARFLGEAAPPPITVEVDPWEIVPNSARPAPLDEIRELIA